MTLYNLAKLCLNGLLSCVDFVDVITGICTCLSGTLPRVTFIYFGISPMITSTKSTHESGPFKHSVVRLYIAALWLI